MRRLIIPLFTLYILLLSCKNEEIATPSQIEGQWQWTIQYANNPAFNSTPQSTGINETISFLPGGAYSVVQNNVVINSGTYKTSVTISTRGELIPTILYSNNRVTDSVEYYNIVNNADSLVFCHDFIGTVGSGSRYYGRKH
ncbi:MAG TPA: hypothetical protein PKC54_08840 [Ferruginibacter sp.]|nr:hypothetical protein [Ferruginibacter sp.]